MIQLMYASTAREPFTAEELAALLLQARAQNHERGLTGLLVYHGGAFLQVLEGRGEAVTEVFERIGRDPRHADLRLLIRREVDEREFGEWSMGFVDPELAAAALEGYLDYRMDLPALDLDEGQAKRVLGQFQAGAWH
jgi:hypothetical protein